MTHPAVRDPEYVQGQIASLQALVAGLAGLLLSKEEFREVSLQRLENLRTAMLPEPVSETRLLAIEHCEDWLRTLTG